MDKLLTSLQQMILSTVAESADAILIADVDGIIRYWNQGAERIFGYSAEEAVGQSLDLIIPENLRGRHGKGYRRVMDSGETKYRTGLLSSPGVHRDGSRISLEFSMVLLHDGGETMLGCAAIMRDVTARFVKEQELRKELAECRTERATHQDSGQQREGA